LLGIVLLHQGGTSGQFPNVTFLFFETFFEGFDLISKSLFVSVESCAKLLSSFTFFLSLHFFNL